MNNQEIIKEFSNKIKEHFNVKCELLIFGDAKEFRNDIFFIPKYQKDKETVEGFTLMTPLSDIARKKMEEMRETQTDEEIRYAWYYWTSLPTFEIGDIERTPCWTKWKRTLKLKIKKYEYEGSTIPDLPSDILNELVFNGTEYSYNVTVCQKQS